MDLIFANTKFLQESSHSKDKNACGDQRKSSSVDSIDSEVTFYIKHIKLTKACLDYLNKVLEGKKMMKLKWRFHGFKDSIKFSESENFVQIKVKLDFISHYQLEINEEFIKSLENIPLVFHLNVLTETQKLVLSEATLSITDFLETVNKRQTIQISFNNALVESSDKPIAHLEFAYKFSCNRNNLKKLMESFDEREISVLDYLKEAEINVDDRGSKTVQSSRSETERQIRLRFQAQWKQTLKENSTLYGENLGNVSWRQWHEENIPKIIRPKLEEVKPELAITIVELSFLSGSAHLKNSNINRVYVEYSFLGKEGPEFETPFSVGLAETMTFDFTKKFDIDIEWNYENCKMLIDMIKKGEVLKFVIVNEPEENVDVFIEICEELGYAEVKLEEIVKLEDNVDIYQYEVFDFYKPLDVIGYIAIKFEGILALRNMALGMMGPKDYGIFFQ